MIKFPLGILLSIILLSCQNQNTNFDFCDNELQLLEAKAPFSAKFYFDLTKEKLFDSLQNQIKENICNSTVPISSDFVLPSGNTINTLLYASMNCPGELKDEPISCFSPYNVQILINKESKLLVENNYVDLKNLDSVLLYQTEYLYKISGGNDNPRHRTIFDISWQEGTPPETKIKIFETTLNVYLKQARKNSKKNFRKDICQLDSMELSSLKQHNTYIFQFSDVILPPDDMKFPDSLFLLMDSIELEISKELK